MPPISAIRNALSAVGKSKAARAAVEGFDYGVAARSAGDSYGGRYGRSVVTNRTPQVLREGLSPLEQVARVGGRVAADSATFATQGLYYAINHPAAIATEAIQRGFSPIGATKQQAALTTLGVATALGVGSRAYGWNPTNIFRPAGYGASEPKSKDNPTETDNPFIEVFDRFRARRGKILPYDKFLEDTGQTREQFPEAQYKDLAQFQANRDAQGISRGVMGGIFRYSGNPYYGPGGAANIFGVDVPVAAAAGAAAIGGTAYGLIRNANQKRFQELSAKVVPLPGGGVDDAALTATERADYDRLSRTIGQTPEAKLEAKASRDLAASDQVLGKNRLPDYPVAQTRTAEGLSQLDPVQLRNEARSRGIKVETTATPEQLIDRIMRSNVRSGFEVSGADMTAFTDAFGTTPAGTPKANTGPSLRPQAAAPRMAKMPGMAANPQAAPVTPPSAPRAANVNTAYEQAYTVAKSRNLRTPSEIAQFIGQTPGLPDDALGTQAIAEQFINRMRKEAAPNLTTDPGFRSQVTGTFDAFGGRQSLRDRLSGGRGGAVSRASNIGAMGLAQPAGSGLPEPVISQRAGQITPTPGSIAQVSPESLTLDPSRFQYKIGYAKGGATGSLKGVEAWNPDLAGVVSVWRDPKDGKDYVVNGHNRIQKALDLNAAQPGTVPQQAVRYLNAGTAAEARSTGALINIAEGQGTAYDAAKFFRDSGATPEKLQAYGIPAGRPVVQQGRALANLHEGLFQQAITGQLPTEQAIAIGESLPDHTDQRALTDLLGRTKRKVSGDVIRELAGDIKASPKTVTEQATLFGTEELIQSNAIEKAETAAYVRKQLRDTASTFGTVSKEGKVAKLTQAGNVLDQAGNAQIATDAGRSLAEFDQLKGQTGAYNDILNEAARRRAAGESASSVNQWAYEQTRTTTAAPRRNAPEALPGGAEPRPERPAARIADPTANRPVSQTPAAPRVATVAAPVEQPSIATMQAAQKEAIARLRGQPAPVAPTGTQAQQAAIARLQQLQPEGVPIAPSRGTLIDIGGGERVRSMGNPFQGASTTAARLSIEAETGAPRRPATMTVGATVPVSRPMQLIPAPTQPNVYDPAGFQRLENRLQNNPPIGSTEYIQNADRIQLRDANLQGTRDVLQQVRDSKGQNRAIVRSPEALGIAPASGGRQQPFAMRSAPYTPTQLDPQASVLAEAYANNPNATYQVGQTTGHRGGVFAYEPAKVNPKAFLPSPAVRSVSNIEAPPNFGAVNRLPNPGYTAIPQNQSLTPYNPNARAVTVGSPRSVQPFEAPRTAVTTAGRVPTIEPRIAAPQNTSTAIAPYTPPSRNLPAVPATAQAGIESSTKVIGTRPRATTPAVEARAEGPLQRAISSITAKNPRLTRIGGAGLQGLGVVGAGIDFTDRLQAGQKLPQAAIGTGAGVVGGTQGFALGAKLTPGGPIPKFVGGLVGGVLGAVGAGAVVDQVAKVEAPDRKQFDASVQKAKQAPGALGALNRAIFAVGDFVNNPVEQIFGKSEGAKLGDRAEQQYQDALKRQQQRGGISPAQQQQLQAETAQQQGIAQQRRQAANDDAARINASSNRLQQEQEQRQKDIQEQIQRNTDSGKVISGDGALRGALSSFFGGGRSPSSGSQPGGGQPTTRSAGLSLGQTTNRTGGGDTQPMGQPNAPRVAQMRQPRTAPRSTVAPQLVPGTPEFEALDSKAKEKALIESSRRASANSRNDTTLQVSGDRSDDNTYRTNARSGDVRYTADSRSGDVRYTADSRSGDVRYTADSRSGDVRYTADSRSGDVRYTADSRSGDVRDTNRTNLQRTNLQHGKGGSEDRVAASKLTGVRENIKGRHEDAVYRTDGTVKVANIKKDSDAYKAQVGYAGKVDSATITGGYKVQQEGVRQSGAANVANIKAGATMGAAVVGANAKVKVAEFGLEGTRYKADATVKVADVNRQSKAETENTKALSAISTGVIRSGAALMQREERDRVARLRALGVY